MRKTIHRLYQATIRRAVRIAHYIGAAARRWRHPILARPLTQAADRDIDAALARAGLARTDLFTPADAISQRRVQMALMLAMHRVDVTHAVAAHWQELKRADQACASCRSAGRCRRWLLWGGLDAAPRMFCPNSSLFEAIAARQTTAHPNEPKSLSGR